MQVQNLGSQGLISAIQQRAVPQTGGPLPLPQTVDQYPVTKLPGGINPTLGSTPQTGGPLPLPQTGGPGPAFNPYQDGDSFVAGTQMPVLRSDPLPPASLDDAWRKHAANISFASQRDYEAARQSFIANGGVIPRQNRPVAPDLQTPMPKVVQDQGYGNGIGYDGQPIGQTPIRSDQLNGGPSLPTVPSVSTPLPQANGPITFTPEQIARSTAKHNARIAAENAAKMNAEKLAAERAAQAPVRSTPLPGVNNGAPQLGGGGAVFDPSLVKPKTASPTAPQTQILPGTGQTKPQTGGPLPRPQTQVLPKASSNGVLGSVGALSGPTGSPSVPGLGSQPIAGGKASTGTGVATGVLSAQPTTKASDPFSSAAPIGSTKTAVPKTPSIGATTTSTKNPFAVK